MSDLPIVNKNSIFAFVLFGRFTKSLLFGIYLLYLLFSLSYLSFIFILADILIFIYSYYRHFFYSFLYFPNLSKICLLASGSCLRFGAEERRLMNLVPAPAVKLMKGRVLSRPGRKKCPSICLCLTI